MPDLWQKVSVKFLAWILQTITPQWLMMSHSIPGMDFTDNYSPVVNDVTFRVVVARMLIENLKGKVVDIDNAFLNGDLEHEMYMKIPEGYDEVIRQGVDKKTP